MRALPFAVSLTGLLLIAGCNDTDPAVTSEPPTVGVSGSHDPKSGYAKEGWFGGADGLHARVEIDGVERQGAKSVLRYSVTSLDSSTKSVPFTISLLDPVGRKLYRPTGSTSGDDFAPGATREMAAEYPTLPTGVQKVTAITPGTAGEFTGIPVTTPRPGSPEPSGPLPGFSTPPGSGSSPPPQFTFPPGFSPPPGFSLPPGFSPPPGFNPGSGGPTWGYRMSPDDGSRPLGAGAPSRVRPSTTSPSPTKTTTPPPSGSGGSPSTGITPQGPSLTENPVELYDLVEGETRDVASGASNETMALRADVLFETGSAKLSSRAKAVLDQIAPRIKATAVGPLTLTGYTDDKGEDAAVLKLSKERAEAVARELKSRLGGTFTYTANGKGKAEPVAKEGGADDAAARARNRRVEITYRVRPTSTAGAPSTGGSAAKGPAEFRPQDGKTVATRYGRFGAAKRRLEVKPFYRDGAYIVAVFDIVNEGPGNTPADAAYTDPNHPGGVFTSFSIQVPGGKDVYRAVRVGPRTPAGGPSAYVGPGRAVYRTGVNQPVRGFVYLPAPPGNVTSVTLDAGPFGKVDKVPVS
ncbi:hypothetical protein GCM10022254_53590 [Actinomadura meridiana]|uniref:OmpA-like domain-containing protein n=1 Tax=Actinomadura meridiana TaxID=559626 RepID=A0ABP8CEG7_9ACTN